VLARPACRCPTAARPLFSVSLPHPATDTGPPMLPDPVCQLRSCRLPLFAGCSHRAREVCTARCYQSSPEPPHPCHASPCRRPPLMPVQTPSFFFRVASERVRPPPPHFSLVPPPRARRFKDTAGVSFHSFPRNLPELEHTHTPLAALRTREASRAPDTAPLPTGFEADVAALPSLVSRGSAPPHSN
jgi:hypothetical protein